MTKMRDKGRLGPSARMQESGRTALLMASFRGHTEVVRTLLKAGANMDAADKVRGRRVFGAKLKSRPRRSCACWLRPRAVHLAPDEPHVHRRKPASPVQLLFYPRSTGSKVLLTAAAGMRDRAAWCQH